jgi:5,10-methylenetetrahydrofolate reductase
MCVCLCVSLSGLCASSCLAKDASLCTVNLFAKMASRLLRLLESASVETTPKLLKQMQSSASTVRFPQATPMFQTCLPGTNLSDVADQACLAQSLGYTAVPHVPATRFKSVEELDNFLGTLRQRCQVDRVLVIGGEREGGGVGVKAQLGNATVSIEQTEAHIESPSLKPTAFADTLALLRTNLLQKHGIRRVCIAGHPDGLPGVPNEVLAASLLQKQQWAQDNGCEMQIVTQFCFDPNRFCRWLSELKNHGIHLPVVVGVCSPARYNILLLLFLSPSSFPPPPPLLLLHIILHSYCAHTALTLCSYCTHTTLILHLYCAHTALTTGTPSSISSPPHVVSPLHCSPHCLLPPTRHCHQKKQTKNKKKS